MEAGKDGEKEGRYMREGMVRGSSRVKEKRESVLEWTNTITVHHKLAGYFVFK